MRVPLKLMHFKSSTLTLNYICMHVCIHDVCIGRLELEVDLLPAFVVTGNKPMFGQAY